MKGCAICNNTKYLFYDFEAYSAEVSVNRELIFNADDEPIRAVKIRFCPMCGRDLTANPEVENG